MWTEKQPLIDLASQPPPAPSQPGTTRALREAAAAPKVLIPRRGLSNPQDGPQWLFPPSIQGFGPWKETLHPMGEGLVAVPALVSTESFFPWHTNQAESHVLEAQELRIVSLGSPPAQSPALWPKDRPSRRCTEL